MNEEANASSNLQSQSPQGIAKDDCSVEVIDEQTDNTTEQAEEKSNASEVESVQLPSTEKEPQQQEDAVKIVVEESSEEKPLTSPPRKSARLSAKRRDSATDSDISVTTKSESPVPRRRSLRRNSTSSQDGTPAKAKEELANKKLPTIVETVDQADGKSKQTTSNDNENETKKDEKALVDELAAAFVEDFIDDDE